MIEGALILVVGLGIGYWIGKPNKVVTAIKREVFSQKAEVVDMYDPLKDIDLGNDEKV